MEFLDYYEILSVPPTASQEQIERAYKRLASISHPDLFPNDLQAQAWANERMKQIHEAYGVLRDPAKRAGYDQTRAAWTAERTRARESEGQEDDQSVRCPLCEGQGSVPCLTCQGRGDASCPGCQGERTVTCSTCLGAGALSREKYQHLIEELLRSEAQASGTPAHHEARHGRQGDPFWQVGYWDRPAPRKESRVALALSVVLPGAGQIYNGEPQKGLTYLGIAFILFLGIGPLKGVGLLLWLGFWAYNVFDAYSTSERAA